MLNLQKLDRVPSEFIAFLGHKFITKNSDCIFFFFVDRIFSFWKRPYTNKSPIFFFSPFSQDSFFSLHFSLPGATEGFSVYLYLWIIDRVHRYFADIDITRYLSSYEPVSIYERYSNKYCLLFPMPWLGYLTFCHCWVIGESPFAVSFFLL